VLADSHSIFYKWKKLVCCLWHLRGEGIRQTEIPTPQPPKPTSSALEVHMALEKYKDTSPFTDPTPAKQI